MLKLTDATKTVFALSAPFRSGGAAAELPQRVRILKWGENIGRTTGARILVDDKATALSRNQELVGLERVPMDYEHQSFPGHPNYKPDPRQSPGGGTIEVVPGEGVFLSAISYTPNGVEHAASYQDVSGVIHLDADGRPLWVSCVALTQNGDVSGMEFTEAVAVLSARSTNPSITPSQNKPTMETTNPHRELLIKLLGLKAAEGGEITDEQITAAVEKATATSAEPPKAESTEALSALSGRLDKIERNAETAERKALVDAATAAGKVIPLSGELIAQTPVAVLSGMIAGLKAGEVPLEGKDTKEKPADRVVALSADEAAAAKQLGLSEEQYRKGKTVTA